jgi:hypothetical protein
MGVVLAGCRLGRERSRAAGRRTWRGFLGPSRHAASRAAAHGATVMHVHNVKSSLISSSTRYTVVIYMTPRYSTHDTSLVLDFLVPSLFLQVL